MTTPHTHDIRDRADGLHRRDLRAPLDTGGHAITPELPTTDESRALSHLIENGRFGSTIDMARHRFGDGNDRAAPGPLRRRVLPVSHP